VIDLNFELLSQVSNQVVCCSRWTRHAMKVSYNQPKFHNISKAKAHIQVGLKKINLAHVHTKFIMW